MKNKVAVVHHKDVKKAMPAALEMLPDLTPLFHGKHVAIKPNDSWASASDITACTQADTLETAIRFIKRYGPKKITVTGGAGASETDRVFKILTLDKVIMHEGVEYFDHNKPPFQKMTLAYGPHPEVMINPHVLEYDTVVSLAQHKDHESAIVTLTMKNIAVSYPAEDYYGHPRARRLHPHNFFKNLHSFIAGMCQKFPIHVGIIVGHPAMVETGQVGGQTFESELVIASTDCVSCDSVGAMLMGYEEVPHILEAEQLGIGTAALDRIEVVGMPLFEAIQLFKDKVRSLRQMLVAY